MRLAMWITICAALTFGLCLPTSARKSNPTQHLRKQFSAPVAFDRTAWRDGRVPRTSAVYDTTVLGQWNFDEPFCDGQGWTSHDRTAQTGVYFHVDDFAGLGGGDFGRLVPLEGSQSLWCGGRPSPSDAILCDYVTLPGYGNSWDQRFSTVECLSVEGDVRLDFLASWDSEPGYDCTNVEFDLCDGTWMRVSGQTYPLPPADFEGTGSGVGSSVLSDSLHEGSVRFRFRFTSDGIWSDEDALWDTDGAIIIDSLTVSDTTGVVLPTEFFEMEAVGVTATASGNWAASVRLPYGDFTGMFPGVGVLQEDPCASNVSCFWGFFEGSTWDYSCGGWPEQKALPRENARQQYLHNEIWSPPIPWIGSGSDADLEFLVYRDLTISGMIFYVWHVRSIVDGCPGEWRDKDFVYYGRGKDWYTARFDIGPYIEPNADEIQIAIGVRDMCQWWCCIYGSVGCRSHSPLIDDVRVFRVAKHGPQWTVRGIDLFQDTFASDGTTAGTARADIANDIKPSSSTGILPGDSVVVTVGDPEFGLSIDPYSGTGPAVYAYIAVRPPGQTNKAGPALTDDASRWPVVFAFVENGDTWYQVRMDSVRQAGGAVVLDQYCLDLHDDLFTPGDTVYFAFGARSAAPSTDKTYWSENTSTTFDRSEVLANAMEFTILPAAGWRRGGDILYVDGSDGRGGQEYWDTAFEILGVFDKVDRFDIRGPSSAVGNHPASRVIDVPQQLVGCYRKIVWDCGDLITAFGDGDGDDYSWRDKSDDTGMLLEFLDSLQTTGGVYLCGDDVSSQWTNELRSASAAQLRTTYMAFETPTHWAPLPHHHYVGVNPLAVGEAGGIFTGAFGPDTLVAYGGCPSPNNFDLVSPMASSSLEMSYHGNGDVRGAVVSQLTANPDGVDVGFVLSGFSYQFIRDAGPAEVPARVTHLYRILSWLDNPLPTPVGVEAAVQHNALSQNYPNPFNPTTTIRYSIAERGRVTLRVYNVAGQLVRTLVDEVQIPEDVEPVVWDGRSDAGQAVSSGVYFYKLSTGGFTQTKKMLILK